MDMQAAPSPYTPAGASFSPMGNPPVLGQQVPGMTGGLPMQGGLSVLSNPLAQPLQSQVQPQQAAQQTQQYGRGDDTMLIHMTPDEVNSLQGLAMAHGGSLTINPHTGLPEAGWLGKLLPTLLGGALTFIPGIGPLAAAGIVGAGQTALTGDLKKGLMAGLGAYGGASMAGALAPTAAGGAAGKLVAQSAAEKAMVGDLTKQIGAAGIDTAKNAALNRALQSQVTNSGLLSRFGAEAAMGTKGLLAKGLPMVAGSAVLGAASDATQPQFQTYKPEEPGLKYTPMAPLQRKVRFQTPEQMEASGGAEYQYYTPVNPEPVPLSQVQQQPQTGFADGGAVAAPSAASATRFEDIVAAYNSVNPGAITESKKYPVTAPPATEQKYDFKPKTPLSPGIGLDMGVGGIDLSGLNLGNVDWSKVVVPATPAAAARADSGNSRTEDFSNIGDYSAPYTPPSYTPPQMLDINAGVQSVPAVQPTYAEPVYQAPVFASSESLGMYPDVNSYGGNAFGRYENVDLYAGGGAVNMRDGAFVVDARTVSELGNGSSNAGLELLSRMGGQPVRGPGDGVSDSVPARIGGKQEARVARDEVIFQPNAVRRIGGGDEKRGTQKLYALMNKAHKARKNAKRGQDTGVRKGLA